jgi:hypothetical protein
MRQEKLTLEGMQQGIRDSDVFILVLTERVLSSWFCNAEITTALDEEKPIQLIVEEESRFHPFNREHWDVQAAAGVEERLVKNQSGTMTAVAPRVVQMVDQHLISAVPYRRRDYEQHGMMRELCRRNGVVLPAIQVAPWPADVPPLRVAFVANIEACQTAAMMFADLKQGLQSVPDRIELMLDVHSQVQLHTADRIILLLTSGVLQEPSLSQVEAVLRFDAQTRQDRMLPVYYPGDWTFGGNEHTSAPAQICTWLNEHEALCYRPKLESDGSSCHEFGVMLDHMLVKLGASAGSVTSPTQVQPLEIATVRQKLACAERELEAKNASVLALSRELDEARSALVSTIGEGEEETGNRPAAPHNNGHRGGVGRRAFCQCCAGPQ